MEILNNLELEILLFIQNTIRLSFLTPIFTFFSSLGNRGSIWLVLVIVLIVNKKTRKVGIYALCGYGLCLFLTDVVLKPLFERPRPFMLYQELIPLLHPQDYSFPSGHTTMAFTISFILYKLLDKKSGIVALVVAFLIAFSRLYVGVHFPTDILGGVLIGWLLASIIQWVYKRKYTKR